MPINSNSKKIQKVAKAIVKKEVSKDVKKMVKKPTMLGAGLRTLGGTLGGLYGMSDVGKKFGAGVSRIFGQGDYVMSGCNNDTDNGPPSFAPLNAGMKISHREYVTDITSSVGFSSTTYYLNPGLNQSFPWLSTVAKNFEEYELKGFVVYLKTNSANAVSSTNTALGMWGVVTQYDATDQDFTTKQQCENYVGTTTAVPSKSVLHAVECKKSANVLSKLYVRSGALGIDQDQKFYDLGKYQVFTQGAQAPSVIGELWISYDVVFTKPRLPSGGLDGYTDRYYLAAGPTNSQPLGTITTQGTGSIGTSFRGSTNDIVFPSYSPEGYYFVNLRWSGGVIAISAPVVTLTGACSAINYFNGGTTSFMNTPQNAALVTSYNFTILVKKTGIVSGTINIGTATLPSTPALNGTVTLVDPETVPMLLATFQNTQKLDLDDIKNLREIIKQYQIKKENKNSTAMQIEEEDEYELPSPPPLKRQNAYIDYDVVDKISEKSNPFSVVPGPRRNNFMTPKGP